MAEAAVFSFLGKALEELIAPIGRQLGYVFFYNGNVKSMIHEADQLEAKKSAVELLVDAGKNNSEVVCFWPRQRHHTRSIDELCSKLGRDLRERGRGRDGFSDCGIKREGKEESHKGDCVIKENGRARHKLARACTVSCRLGS